MSYDISVIIPIFNAEEYLASTLGNVLNQTKKEIQIILVNDASTDGSLRIMKDAKAAFGERVLVVDLPENGGPGAARNKGLDLAEGEYIGFVDSDDIIDVTMYEKLYNSAKATDSDIVDCAYYRDSTQKALIHFSSDAVGELDDKKRSTLIGCGGFNVMKIFRKSMLDREKIRFRHAYVLEDTDFLVRAILCAKRVSNVEEVLYRYRDEVLGSLTKVEPIEEYIKVQLSAMDAVYAAAKDYPSYSEVQEAVEIMLVTLYKNMIVRVVHERKTLDFALRKKYLGVIKEKRAKCILKNPLENRYIGDKLNKDEIELIKIAEENEGKLLFWLRRNKS